MRFADTWELREHVFATHPVRPPGPSPDPSPGDLPIVPEIAVLVSETGLTHGDPADSLIVATATHHGARLVAADAALRALKAVRTVW